MGLLFFVTIGPSLVLRLLRLEIAGCAKKTDPCPPPPLLNALFSALQAIPEDLPVGQQLPELRLLPGLYTGDGNVFLGGPADLDYPSTAR